MAKISNRFHYCWVIIVMGNLVVFGSLGLARFGYTVVLPVMQISIGMNNAQAGMLATANLIGYLALSFIGGALASRFGPRLVITLGLGLAAFGMIMTGLSNGFLSASIWRALTGIGSGASNVPVMGLMSAWFGQRRRGLAAGIVASGSSVALIVLGLVIPRILTGYTESGWRVSWFGYGGLTFLLAILGAILLRNRPSDMGIEALCADSDSTAAKKTEKLRWRDVYGSTAVWHLGLVYIAFGFSYIIYMTFFAKHLIAGGGYTKETAGKLFMIMGWFSLLCGLIWGMVSDSIGRKRALIIVYLLHAVSFSLFGLWISPVGFTISAILFGLSAWSIPAIMAAACGDVLGAKFAPAALGFITLFFGIGQAIAPSIAGFMADYFGSFSPAFLLAGLVALLGAIGSSFLRSTSKI